MGHSALYTMCRILQDPGVAQDVCLLRGAVFHVNMALWGTKRVTTLKCTSTSVLPSFLSVSVSYCATFAFYYWNFVLFMMSILHKSLPNALIYVNTTLFTLSQSYMFQPSSDHPQGVQIHFVSRANKIYVQI